MRLIVVYSLHPAGDRLLKVEMVIHTPSSLSPASGRPSFGHESEQPLQLSRLRT